MRIRGIDQSVKNALWRALPELVAELQANRCLDEVFPSIKSEIYQGYFEDKSADEVFREIIFYAPFNTSRRENMEGVEFRLYFDSFNGNDLQYNVEIVIPSYLADIKIGMDRDSLGTVLLQYVTEQVSEILAADAMEPAFYSEEYDNKCFGYRVIFDIK